MVSTLPLVRMSLLKMRRTMGLVELYQHFEAAHTTVGYANVKVTHDSQQLALVRLDDCDNERQTILGCISRSLHTINGVADALET